MASDTKPSGPPKFEWDYDIPDTPFWKDMDMRVARNFMACYTPDETASIPFEHHAASSIPAKLEFLLAELQTHLTTREAAAAPAKLYDTDPDTWQTLLLAIGTAYKFLGRIDDEAATIYSVLEHSGGDQRVPWLNMLSRLEGDRGRFAEAEALARQVLPWMQNHEKLGIDSPQALGTTRTIIRNMWKQGGAKQIEAQGLVADTYALIDRMDSSKFAKYQSEEREMLQELVVQLEKQPGNNVDV